MPGSIRKSGDPEHPENNNIRLAPTFPDNETLGRCMKIFTNIVKYLN